MLVCHASVPKLFLTLVCRSSLSRLTVMVVCQSFLLLLFVFVIIYLLRLSDLNIQSLFSVIRVSFRIKTKLILSIYHVTCSCHACVSCWSVTLVSHDFMLRLFVMVLYNVFFMFACHIFLSRVCVTLVCHACLSHFCLKVVSVAVNSHDCI